MHFFSLLSCALYPLFLVSLSSVSLFIKNITVKLRHGQYGFVGISHFGFAFSEYHKVISISYINLILFQELV